MVEGGPETVYVSLGSNLGDRYRLLMDGVEALRELAVEGVVKVSPVYESEPWGNLDQPSFLNCASEMMVVTTPLRFLDDIQDVEWAFGRRGDAARWGPRRLDIDILLFGGLVYEDERLKIPHAYLVQRRFFLAPLADLAPGLAIPGVGVSVRRALANCPDRGAVVPYLPGIFP